MDTKTFQLNLVNRASIVLVLFALLLLVAGCGRMQAAQPIANSNYTLSLAVQPDPPVKGPAQLSITLVDLSGKGIDGAQLHVEGNMAHAGMVPVIVDAQGGQAGRYTVPLTWTMDGDWVVTVKATLPGGAIVTRDFPVRVGK